MDHKTNQGERIRMEMPSDFNTHLVKAENGGASSMFYVAECYADSARSPKDIRLAAQWFKKSAKQGVVDGMYELAGCYITGSGVPQDLERARFWIQKAYYNDHLMTESFRAKPSRQKEVLRLMMMIELSGEK